MRLARHIAALLVFLGLCAAAHAQSSPPPPAAAAPPAASEDAEPPAAAKAEPAALAKEVPKGAPAKDAPAKDAKASPAGKDKANAKDKGNGNGKAAAKAKKPPPVPAKQLFGAVKVAAPLAARSIGFYAKGCLAGAKPLPIDGPAWQAMRLSRNRNWGHPDLIALLERFAGEVKKNDGWPGLLFGDISQPRGGPMLTGHASHQIGLDADVWLTPMPDRRLSEKEREDLSATSMLAADKISVDPNIWTPQHIKILKRAASYSQVERVLVHPAIKKALCDATPAAERGWLHKVRPYWGHFYHFHIRISCPKGSAGCTGQPPPPGEDGCGKELEDWLKLIAKPPPPPPKEPVTPAKPKPPMTLDELPAECKTVLEATDAPKPKPVEASKPAAATKAKAAEAPVPAKAVKK